MEMIWCVVRRGACHGSLDLRFTKNGSNFSSGIGCSAKSIPQKAFSVS